MDSEDEPDRALGFEDEQTLAQLQLMDDLQKLGLSNYSALPQVKASVSRSLFNSAGLVGKTEEERKVAKNLVLKYLANPKSILM